MKNVTLKIPSLGVISTLAIVLAGVIPASGAQIAQQRHVFVAKQPTIAALLPAAIANSGTLRIGTDPTLAPLEFSLTPGAPLTGADIDLANAVAGVLGLRTTFVPTTFNRLFGSVSKGTIDVAWSSITDTKERQKTLDFVDYLATGERFFSRKGTPALKAPFASAACGKSIIVANGTIHVTQALAAWQGCLDAHRPGITLRSVVSVPIMAARVQDHTSDYGFQDAPICSYAVATSHGSLVLASPIFFPVHYGIASRHGSRSLNAALAAAMNYLIRTGTYRQILTKWGLSSSAMTAATINRP